MSQEIIQESWFGRLGKAFKGIVTGITIFLAAFPLLWWNEGRAVKTVQALTEGANAVQESSADSVNPEDEGKFVHVTGEATTVDVLEDPEFGISVNAIRLSRNVEMYQWKENIDSETRKKIGGGTETVKTYSYEKVWSSSAINSGGFHDAGHDNPGSLPINGLTKTARDVHLGVYQLPDNLIGSISKREALSVSFEHVPQNWHGVIRRHGANGFYLPANYSQGRGQVTGGQTNTQAQPAGGAPQIGDVRITYEVTRPSTVSIMSQQAGTTFTPFKTSNGKPLNMLAMGNVPTSEMISRAEAENTMWTWVLRGVGFLMIGIGLGMVFKPLSVLADVLPIAGDIVQEGTGMISFCIAGACSLGTISVAWLAYRPLIGVPLLLAGVGLFSSLVFFLLKARAARSTAPAAKTVEVAPVSTSETVGEPVSEPVEADKPVSIEDIDEAISI